MSIVQLGRLMAVLALIGVLLAMILVQQRAAGKKRGITFDARCFRYQSPSC